MDFISTSDCDDKANNHKSNVDDFIKTESVLLQWKDMPQHLQFNPYVLTGYRPLQTFKGCMSSLFYMHNETINILTHGKFSWTKHFVFQNLITTKNK